MSTSMRWTKDLTHQNCPEISGASLIYKVAPLSYEVAYKRGTLEYTANLVAYFWCASTA